MNPQKLSIKEFSYELPDYKIAKHPVEERDSSKLLIYKSGKIESDIYRNVDCFLPENSLLVFNNTKVVEARLMFQKQTGALIEIFCLEPDEQYKDITTAMLQKGYVFWKCLVGGASKWKHGMQLEKIIKKEGKEIVIKASITNRLSDCFVIEFMWEPTDISFAELLHEAGSIPLPPYLHRDVEEDDKKRYQTVYAEHDGSVAAPTAGLHFTEAVFKKLEARNIQKDFVTLHVGAGTFKPVKAEIMEDHEMHAEFIDVSNATIQNLIAHLNKVIVAVGTTSLRTIESLYWIGIKVYHNPDLTQESLSVEQWEPYENRNAVIKPEEALTALLKWMDKKGVSRIVTKTQILIAPSYQIKIAKGIITNFHQPKSTLLLLIAAIVGDDWKKIYDYALQNDYRFLSYGDGCLLWKTQLDELRVS